MEVADRTWRPIGYTILNSLHKTPLVGLRLLPPAREVLLHEGPSEQASMDQISIL